MYIDQHGKKWFKANLHTHTTVSDGRKSPEDAIALYKEKGYDILSLTDHWKLSKTEQKDGMLMLSGIEYNINGSDILKGVYHIVGIGMSDAPNLDRNNSCLTAQEIIDNIHAHNGIAVLAHPAWSMNTVDQLMPLNNVDTVEIYNSVSGLPHNCRPDSSIVIDLCAARGKAFPCSASDDSHFYDGEEGYSYIYIQADELTESAVMDAIRAGRFYATQGPKFSVDIGDVIDGKRTIKLECDETVETIVFYTGTVWANNRSISGVHEAVFELKESDRFVRIECIDKNGNRGFGSPILF